MILTNKPTNLASKAAMLLPWQIPWIIKHDFDEPADMSKAAENKYLEFPVRIATFSRKKIFDL